MGLLACAAVVVLDIVLRQFGHSFGGTDEISGYVMAIAAAWGMSYTLLELGHVRIDFIRSRIATRGRVLFDLFSLLVLAATISIIAYPVLAGTGEVAGKQLACKYCTGDTLVVGAGTLVGRLDLVCPDVVDDANCRTCIICTGPLNRC